MSESLLQSEQIPSADRVARVRESRARAQRERASMAADFRSRLIGELVIDGSATQEGLITCAVSAHVEITVVTGRFLRCCATADEMARLQQARNAFNKAIRLLGVAPQKRDAPGNGPVVGGLSEWLARRAAAQNPAKGEPDAASEAVSVQSEDE